MFVLEYPSTEVDDIWMFLNYINHPVQMQPAKLFELNVVSTLTGIHKSRLVSMLEVLCEKGYFQKCVGIYCSRCNARVAVIENSGRDIVLEDKDTTYLDTIYRRMKCSKLDRSDFDGISEEGSL